MDLWRLLLSSSLSSWIKWRRHKIMFSMMTPFFKTGTLMLDQKATGFSLTSSCIKDYHQTTGSDKITFMLHCRAKTHMILWVLVSSAAARRHFSHLLHQSGHGSWKVWKVTLCVWSKHAGCQQQAGSKVWFKASLRRSMNDSFWARSLDLFGLSIHSACVWVCVYLLLT